MHENNPDDSVPMGYTVLWGFAKYVPCANGMRLQIVWKRILIFFLCAFIFTWTLKSAAIFGFFKYSRGYNDITIIDSVIFPLNRRGIAKKFGEKQLAEANTAIASGNYSKALFLLRTGLGRSPANRDARINLAGIMRDMGEDEIALELYRGGLEYHSSDPFYMKAYLQTLLDYRMDAELRNYANERLASATGKLSDTDRVIAYALAKEEEANGRFAESVALIRKYYLAGTIDGCVLLAKNHWRSGDPDGAIFILNRYILEHPRIQPEGVYQSLYRYYLELGRNSEAAFCALNHVNNAPKSFFARRELIESYTRDGNTAKADTEIRNYLRNFSRNNDALMVICDFAIQSGNEPLAEDAYALAAENAPNMAAMDILLSDICVSSGNYEQTIRNCDIVEGDAVLWLKKLQDQFDYLRMTAAHLQNQESMAEIHFEALLNSNSLTPDNMLNMSRRIRKLGMDNYALKLLEHAMTLAPRNEDILSEIIQIDLDNNLDSDFVKNVGNLLGLRSPGLTLLTRIRPRLDSDHFIFDANRDAVLAKLDAAIASTEAAKKSL